MRVIVAGSRSISDQRLVDRAIEESGFEITVLLSGCARGVDKCGEDWALKRGILVDRHPADWALYGRVAGKVRNRVMADRADALVAVWDGSSPGTRNMIGEMERRGKPVWIRRTT